LTLEEAHRIAIGVENYWLDHPPSPELGPRPPDLRVLFAQRA
jgi:hypothetical protein